jgi:hypothetical protein
VDRLEKHGYHLSLPGWVGNLGNHLIQLSCALNVAQQTESRLTVPEHWLIRPRSFDFMNRDNDNCHESVSSRFFYQPDCFQFPLKYDDERRKVFQEFVRGMIVKRRPLEWLRDLMPGEKDAEVGPETLVINMRSGRDIFRQEPPPQNDYMQPPLSFYKRVIESNGYKDCLIVTEADRKNPCIQALQQWDPRIRLKIHRSIIDDARTLLSATNLVTCHSTFSWCLALMSKNLRTLHQPGTFQIKGVSDFDTYTYFFENYINPGEWTASNSQLEMMTSHSTNDVRVVHSTETDFQSGSERPLSNFW